MEPDDWEFGLGALQAQFEADHPFGRTTMELAGEMRRVLVARSAEQRARGMIGRRFHDFEAMLFVFPAPTVVTFHNRGVPVPLAVGFYDAEGELVDQTEFPATVSEVLPDWERYTSGEPVTYVVEADPSLMRSAFPPVHLDVPEAALTAQEMKRSPEAVNLRPAAMGDEARCSNCDYYLGGGSCELVSKAGADLVCNLFAPNEETRKNNPDVGNDDNASPGTPVPTY